jgi:hypothetical protein
LVISEAIKRIKELYEFETKDIPKEEIGRAHV